MTQRISPHDLYLLRNAVPIDKLIKSLPTLSAKKTEGILRFHCPLCAGFNTATNPRTNLARCFTCCNNFNTIDLVMLVKKVSFKEAVTALSAYYQRLATARPGPPSVSPAPPPQATPSAHYRPSAPLTSIRAVLECALAKLNQPPRSPNVTDRPPSSQGRSRVSK